MRRQYASALLEANRKRQHGNAAFGAGNYQAALDDYQSVSETLTNLMDQHQIQEGSQEYMEFMIGKVPAEINMVACYSQMGMHDETIALATKIMKYDTMYMKRMQHAKLCYRRAMAFGAKKRYMESFKDFDMAMIVAADEVMIRNASKKITEEWAESLKTRDYENEDEKKEYDYYCEHGMRPGEDRYGKNAPYVTSLSEMLK